MQKKKPVDTDQWWKDTGVKEIRVEPYKVLANIYDQVMTHVDYSRWFEFVMDLISDHARYPGLDEEECKLLECACGTGNLAVKFALEDFSVDAFDKSTFMVEIAKSKALGMSEPPRFQVKDFLELNAENEYDIVVCLYDSVNYLSEIEAVIDFFSRVETSLKPDGVFIFDICTETNSRLFFNERSETYIGNGFAYRREMKFNPRAMLQENFFSIRFDKKPRELYNEHHKQRIYTIESIREAVSEADLVILEETEEFERRPPGQNALRVHFICSKE